MSNKSNHLKNEQRNSGDHQAPVGSLVKQVKTAPGSPLVDEEKDRDERNHLPKLHAHIEGKDFGKRRLVAHRQLLQTGRQPKTVYQSESEHHVEQMRGVGLEISPETVEVLKTLVQHRQGNDRINQVVVGGNAEQRGADERDAVPQRERRDEAQDVLEIFEEKHHTDQEQQMVVTGEHVFGTDENIGDQPAVGQHFLIGLRHAVCHEQGGRKGKNDCQQNGQPNWVMKKLHGMPIFCEERILQAQWFDPLSKTCTTPRPRLDFFKIKINQNHRFHLPFIGKNLKK